MRSREEEAQRSARGCREHRGGTGDEVPTGYSPEGANKRRPDGARL